MRSFVLPVLLTGLLSNSVAGAAPLEPPLDNHEIAFLCSLPGGLKAYPHVSNQPKDMEAFAAAAETRKGVTLRMLPQAISCQGKARTLTEGTEFLNQLGFSSDQSFAVVAGGHVRGPLNGQGGECYFTRKGEQWSFLGCMATWVS
jgi:hypothetical protein